MNFVLPTLIWQESIWQEMHNPERTGLWACMWESSWLRIDAHCGQYHHTQMFLGYLGNLAKNELASKPERLPASSVPLHGLFCGSMPWWTLTSMCKTNKRFPSLFSFSKNILSQHQKSKQEQLTSCYLHICHNDPDPEQWHVALVRTQRGRTSQTSLLTILTGTVTQEDMLAVPRRTKYIWTIYFSNHAPWDSLHKRWKTLPTGKCVCKSLSELLFIYSYQDLNLSCFSQVCVVNLGQ